MIKINPTGRTELMKMTIKNNGDRVIKSVNGVPYKKLVVIKEKNFNKWARRKLGSKLWPIIDKKVNRFD